jgi:isoquinoline 1-oxidoreductase subunit alpha
MSNRLRSSGRFAMISLEVNGRRHTVDVDAETPLLWVLRDTLKLTGTKYGCGEGICGACTVHIGGKAVRSCITTAKEAEGKQVTTIEGISESHPVKRAWINEEVSQCGYCQPGQIMSAAALLREKPDPTEPEIDSAMDGNLCRCGTYPRIKRAIRRAAEAKRGTKP